MAAEEPIRSRKNPLVQRLRALKERHAGEDLCLLEGPKLVEEALGAGVEVVEAALGTDAARAGAAAAALRARGVPVRLLSADVLASLSEAEATQGLLALARRPRFDEDALYRAPALVLVAAGVQNPGNLGALLRSAEAAGATGAYLAEGCADPFGWKALRGSMGSAFRVPHRRGLALGEVLRRLHARGVATLAAVADAPHAYDQVDLCRPVALLFGHEGAGLPAEALAQARERVSIPMAGAVESLNVGAAAAVMLFEAARQRRT